MSLFYTLAYWLGFTPWEEAVNHPPAVGHIEALFDREERERPRPLGHALDLGCGAGYWSVALARRGWRVTGIERVGKAVRAARERVRAAGVDANIVQGDATCLPQANIGCDFDFIWDFGAIHGLSHRQCLAVGVGVTTITRPGATLLVLAWAPRRRGPLPRGLSREEIETLFPAWRIIEAEPFDATGLPASLRNVEPTMYRLRRDG